jgi:hypothetical protein
MRLLPSTPGDCLAAVTASAAIDAAALEAAGGLSPAALLRSDVPFTRLLPPLLPLLLLLPSPGEVLPPKLGRSSCSAMSVEVLPSASKTSLLLLPLLLVAAALARASLLT